MKKITSVILAIALLLALCTSVALAYSEGCLYYDVIDDSTITITGYYGKQTEITVPSTINGHPVTAIGSGAFSENKNILYLKTLYLPSTIEKIADGAIASSIKNVYYDYDLGLNISVTVNGTQRTTVVKLDGSFSVYAAVYDANGRFVVAESAARQASETQMSLSITSENIPSTYKVKLFFLDGAFCPIGAAVSLT